MRLVSRLAPLLPGMRIFFNFYCTLQLYNIIYDVFYCFKRVLCLNLRCSDEWTFNRMPLVSILDDENIRIGGKRVFYIQVRSFLPSFLPSFHPSFHLSFFPLFLWAGSKVVLTLKLVYDVLRRSRPFLELSPSMQLRTGSTYYWQHWTRTHGLLVNVVLVPVIFLEVISRIFVIITKLS